MVIATATTQRPRYYGLFWRWHFFAALIVIPFVLWQSTTGTIYLWSEWTMDKLHPEMRFVPPNVRQAAPSAQIAAALATLKGRGDGGLHARPDDGSAMTMNGEAMSMPMSSSGTGSGPTVLGLLLPDNPSRSTTVLLQSKGGLAYPVFVNPHTAQVLGKLSPVQWWPGWSRSLHSGWPLGKPGNMLLELGDCWAIVMILTGFYLWWPRNRPFPEVLWPRFHRGTRILLRDLHSSVAVIFSGIFLFFLISALPWTSFWGGRILSRVEAATGQSSPAAFSLGGASPEQMINSSAALDEAVKEARKRQVKGTLDIRLSPWSGAGWWLANVRTIAPDHTLQAAPGTGHIVSDITNPEIPAIPRFVALGIHVHQGDFGPLNLWLNTLFALSLVWLAVTGAISWWIRRPSGSLGAPPSTAVRWSRGLKLGVTAMCLVLPSFGLSVVLILISDRVVRRFFPSAEPVQDISM